MQFAYSLHGIAGSASNLSFYIDDALQATYSVDITQAVSLVFPLSPGHHVLRWRYTHQSSVRAGAYLHWIALSGVGEGGAPECRSCPAGTYSQAGASNCLSCPAGTTSNPNRDKCVNCRWFEYNDIVGNPAGCLMCPNYTMASSDHMSCIGKVNISAEYEYSLRPFIELGQSGSPLLCDRGRFKHRCQGPFFGPVINKEKYFFISVTRAGLYSHSSYSRLDNLTQGYAYGIIEKKDLPVKESDLNMPDEACVAEYGKMVVNLGTRIQQISISDSGFTVSYADGALCHKANNSHFASVIHFHCNKTAGDGWPQLLYVSNCEYHFTWDSRLACHLCESSELSIITGKCVGNQRYSFYEEGSQCIYPSAGVLLHMEPCSETGETMRSWPFLLATAAALFLIVVVVWLTCVCCKRKRQYERLIEYREEPAKPQAAAEEL